MPEMTVGKIEQLTLEQKAQMLADGMKGIPIDAAIRISKVFDQIAFDRDIELTILRSRVAKLEAELKLKDAAIEKYLPCPDHRDKTGEGCYVCRTESRLALLEGLLREAEPYVISQRYFALAGKDDRAIDLSSRIAAAIEQKGEHPLPSEQKEKP